jgi:hypothetical protein
MIKHFGVSCNIYTAIFSSACALYLLHAPLETKLHWLLFHNFLAEFRYWDLRQANPVHTQQLGERCYAMTVRYPLMVIGTADRNMIVYNLQSPQVMVSHGPEFLIGFTEVLFHRPIILYCF